MSDAREVILQGAHGDIDIHENGDFHMTCPMSRAIDAGLAALAAEGLTICRAPRDVNEAVHGGLEARLSLVVERDGKRSSTRRRGSR